MGPGHNGNAGTPAAPADPPHRGSFDRAVYTPGRGSKEDSMSESDTAPQGFIAEAEKELREDATADKMLAEELVADLVDKVHALERRIAKLEHGN